MSPELCILRAIQHFISPSYDFYPSFHHLFVSFHHSYLVFKGVYTCIHILIIKKLTYLR